MVGQTDSKNSTQKTTIIWDVEPMKKNIKEGIDSALDALAPVTKVALQSGVIASAELIKNTDCGRPLAPVIDFSTTTIAPIAINKSVESTKTSAKGVSYKSTDTCVDTAHTVSVKSVESFDKSMDMVPAWFTRKAQKK